MYPKSRIDALTDGLFAVAMTLLVLDLRLPDAFHADSAGLIGAVKGLWPKFFPYALSFYVLGSTWLGNARLRSTTEFLGKRYVSWWLLDLFVATCLPFSTSVVGQYAYLKPAVWLYSFNMAVLAIVGYRLIVLLPNLSDDDTALARKVALSFVIATSAACIALSAINPKKALFVYLLNFVEPQVTRWITSKRAAQRALLRK